MKVFSSRTTNKLVISLVVILAGLTSCAQSIKPTKNHFQQGFLYQEEAKRLLEQSKAQYKEALADPSLAAKASLRLAEVYFQEGRYSQSIKLLKTLEDIPPTGLRILALCHYRLNQLPQAKQALDSWEEIEPKEIEVQYYLGLIKEKQHLFDEAIVHYQEVIEQAPQTEFARDSRNHLAEIEAETGLITLASLKDEEVKTIIQQAPGSKDYPNAGAAILLDEVHTTIHPDNTRTTTFHKLIKILDDRGKGFGEVELGFDSTYQTVKIDFARTIKEDGTVVPVGKKSWRELSPWSGFPMYSNVKMLVISMPEVVVGSVIEYKATINSSHLVTDDDFQFGKSLQSHEPKLIQRMSLTVPKDRSWKIHFLRTDELKPQIEKNSEAITYRWELRDAEQIFPEPMMPPWADILPYMMVSSFDDWQEISSWFSELASEQLKPDEAIKQKVVELIAGKEDLRDRAREIFHWVGPQVRYVGLEYGVSGYKPHAVSEIFKNKYGDCKDQSSLLISMLREAGVKAYLVLISTQDSGRISKEIPMLQFNHCIAAAEIDGELIWLDPTYETCTFGHIPAGNQDREALVFFEDGARFVRTPSLKAQENKITKNIQLNIQADGGVLGHSQMLTSGKYNMGYRHMKYVRPIKRKEMLQSIINGTYPGGELLEYSFSGLEDLNQKIEISMDYKGPNYLKKAGNLRIFQLPGVGGSAAMVGKEKRTYPIFFASTSYSQNRVQIKIPSKFRVKYLPPQMKLDLPAVSYHAKYELVDNNTILYQEDSLVRGREIPVSAYQEYKHFRERVAKFGEESIVLEEID